MRLNTNMNNIHYIFGLENDFGGKPWIYLHHLSVKSAKIINPDYKIHFWFTYPPKGKWWEKSMKYIDFFHKIKPPESIYNKPFYHYAHKAYIIRLMALKKYGGVYIDSDVLCLKPFSQINHCGFWMGMEENIGLCNATMGGDKQTKFIDIWLESYKTFNPLSWGGHAVIKPLELSKQYNDLITVYPKEYFFQPYFKNLKDIFKETDKKYLKESFTVHLWQHITYDFLKEIDPKSLNKKSEIGSLLLEKNIISLTDE